MLDPHVPRWFVEGTTKEIVVGMLGGLIVWAGASLKRFVVNRFDRHRFPLAGEYISQFEDETNHGKVWMSAPAKLKQHGLNVDGVTHIGDKKWRLSGTIDPKGGYVSGVYSAENPYDRGVGNFFLMIQPDNDLIGLWSGYDSTNEKISVGGYRFHKVAPIKIRKVSKETAASCMAIAENQLGKDYIPEKDFLNTNFYPVYGMIKCDVAGFAIGKEFEQQDFLAKFQKISQRMPNALPWADTICMVSSVAVRQDYQGRGVGYAIVQDVLQHFDKRNVSMTIMLGWAAPDGVHIAGIAHTLGFSEKATIPEYWHDDSLSKGYQCHVCGSPPCRCSAVLYVRHRPIH